MNRLVDNCKAFMVSAVEGFERRVLTGEIDIGQGFKTGTRRLAANTLWNLVVLHNKDDPDSDFAQATKWLPNAKREQFNTLPDDVKAACKVAASEVNEHTALQQAKLCGSGRSTRLQQDDQGSLSQSWNDNACSTRFFMLDHPQGVTLLDPASQQHDFNPPQDPPPPIVSSFPVCTWDPASSTCNSRRQSTSSGGPERAKRSKKISKDTRDRYVGLSGRPAQHPRARKAPRPANNGASTSNHVGSSSDSGDLELVAANSFTGESLSTQAGPCSVSGLGSTVDSWPHGPPNLAQGNQGGLSSFEQQLAWLNNLPTVGFDLCGEECNHLSSQADIFSVSDAATPSSTTTSSDFFSQAASPATTDLSSHSEDYSTPSLQPIELPNSTTSFPTTAPLNSLPIAAVDFASQQSSSTAQFDPQSVFSWGVQGPHGGMKDSGIGFWPPAVTMNEASSAMFASASTNDYRPPNSWHQGGDPTPGTDSNPSDQSPTSLAFELNQDMSNSVNAYQQFALNGNGVAATGEGQVQAACQNSFGLSGGAHLSSNSDFFDTGTVHQLKEMPITPLRQSVIGTVDSGPATRSTFSTLDGALGNSTATGGHFNGVSLAPSTGSAPARNLHGSGFGPLQAFDPSSGVQDGVGMYGSQFTSGSNGAVGSAFTTAGYGYGDLAAQFQATPASGYHQPVSSGGSSLSASNQLYGASGPGVNREGGRFPRFMVQRYEFF